MTRPIVLHSRQLVDWLNQFAAASDLNTFKKGIALYRNKRIWDYHSSSGGLNASVEGHQHSFYQVNVSWSAPFDPVETLNVSLPELSKQNIHCTCSHPNMPCEHVMAAVIYWIIDLDKKSLDRRPSLAIPGFVDTDYEKKLDKFKKLSSQKAASFADFDVDKLRIRPDLQKKVSELSTRVMHQMRNKRNDS
ncbi:hypothetical protein EWI07_00530 [Sporolactobacillus sp. THM7-4]|nr:hypothetical protein EWI07_00530 [Sporolactobacillus sp. THM7-4]